MSLFSSLEEYIPEDKSQDKDNISRTIRSHLLDANHLLLLFMHERQLVLDGLSYFSQNPSVFVNDKILGFIKSEYGKDLDIETAIKEVKSNLSANSD